ncbi:MAG TPA: BTAD domain-containing putative transcriptional regulator [Acidimicrobiia bacterium]
MDLRLFGRFLAVRDEEVLDLGSIGQKAVLAVLALHAGRLITINRLIELLWGEEPPKQAVHTIRVYVSRLRSVLERDPTQPELLLTESSGYRLTVGVESVDALRFEQLAAQAQATSGQEDPGRLVGMAEEAFRLWSDEPLAEFSGHEFAEEARRRLDLIRADLTETWAEARLALGGEGGIVERLQGLLVQDPYRERAWELLALAQYRGGRQTEALRTLRQARAELEGIGLEPGRSLGRLEEAIFQHDVSLLLPPRPGVHNLPLPMDRFVGRHGEMEQLRRLLDQYRLVTVTGPGGSGKTRLAVEMARTELANYPEGVWMVDLAPIEEDQLVASIMEALDTSPGRGLGDIRDLIGHLKGRNLLLLLDNAEHLIGEVAGFVVKVLENCSGIQVLTTSRESLRVPGEATYSIGPLRAPGADVSSAVELAEYDAVALLRERAGSRGEPLEENEETVRYMASIARRLDGIPLAIELAATRLAAVPIADLSRRIDDVFSSLGVGLRTVLPRHRTLRATFDWSYQLLTPTERDAFDALSLFRGDFDLSAAVSVIGDTDADVSVEALVSKSMLTLVSGPETRYRLLEPLRQFGVERLQGDRLSRATARRDRHFSRVGEELSGVRVSDDPSLQARFTRERRHLESTIEHLLEEGAVQEAARLAVGLGAYWMRLGLYERGISLFKSVLARRPRDDLSELFLGLAWLLSQSGEYGECDQVIASARAAGCDIENVEWNNLKGSFEGVRGDMRSAMEYLTRGVESARERETDLLPALLINLSAGAAWMGAVEQSAHYATEASDAARRMWHRPSDPLISLLEGIQARMSGDLERADRQLELAARGLYISRSDFHLGLALIERATAAMEEGDMERAQDLVEEAFAVAVHRDRGPLFIRMRGQAVLARIAWHQGDEYAVRQMLTELIEGSLASGGRIGLAMAGDLAAEVAMVKGQEKRASELLASTSLLRHQLGFARDSYEEQRYQHLHARLPETSGAHAEALSAMIADFLHESADSVGGRPLHTTS